MKKEIAEVADTAGVGILIGVLGALYSCSSRHCLGVAGTSIDFFIYWLISDIDFLTQEVNATVQSELIISTAQDSSVTLLGGNDVFISRSELYTYSINGGADSIFLRAVADIGYGGAGVDVIYTGLSGGTAYGDGDADRLIGREGSDNAD